MERSKSFESGSGRSGNTINGKQSLAASERNSTPDIRMGPCVMTQTMGWRATCTCGAATVPCTVLDPFLGSGTTAKVAQQYGRNFIGIELSPEYLELARDRFKQARLFW